eukprot:721432-Pyramimonas_sp.AAC.1
MSRQNFQPMRINCQDQWAPPNRDAITKSTMLCERCERGGNDTTWKEIDEMTTMTKKRKEAARLPTTRECEVPLGSL